MNLPVLPNDLLHQRLQHPSRWLKDKVRMVLDTDTYNEIDAPFALVYSLRPGLFVATRFSAICSPACRMCRPERTEQVIFC